MTWNKTSIVFLMLCLLVSTVSAGQMLIKPMQISDVVVYEDVPCHGDNEASSQETTCCDGDCSSCLAVSVIPVSRTAISQQKPTANLVWYLQTVSDFEPDHIYHPPIHI